jgi:hypothetical protein
VIGIFVIAPVIFLDPMLLHVINAGGWELRMLRSVGQLGPTLGSFTDLFVLAVIVLGIHAPPLRRPRFPLRPALSLHRSPQGQRDGAVAFLQATPPPVELR